MIHKSAKTLVAAILLVTLLCVIPCALAQTDATAKDSARSPMIKYATYAELCAAMPDLVLSDAPSGATEVSYDSIQSEPLIAQILFTLDGHAYNYRAAAAATEEVADDQEHINGLYINFDRDVDGEDVQKGKKFAFTLPSAFTFEFELEYNEKSPEVSMDWYIPEAKTQYSLFSQTAGMPNMAFLNVVLLMQPAK